MAAQKVDVSVAVQPIAATFSHGFVLSVMSALCTLTGKVDLQDHHILSG